MRIALLRISRLLRLAGCLLGITCLRLRIALLRISRLLRLTG